MIVIEKNVPFVTRRDNEVCITGVLKTMEVGDSFLHPKAKRTSLCCMAARIDGKKFATRTVSETEVRVWRIA